MMKFIQTIKDIIFKVKDYDRLESNYSTTLDYVTGGILSMTNYTMESVYYAIRENFDKRDKIVREETIKEVCEWLKENATYIHPRTNKKTCMINLNRLIQAMEE